MGINVSILEIENTSLRNKLKDLKELYLDITCATYADTLMHLNDGDLILKMAGEYRKKLKENIEEFK